MPCCTVASYLYILAVSQPSLAAARLYTTIDYMIQPWGARIASAHYFCWCWLCVAHARAQGQMPNCYSVPSLACSGNSFKANSPRDCCLGEGHWYGFHGEACNPCRGKLHHCRTITETCRVGYQCSDGRYIRTPDLHIRGRYRHQFYPRTKLTAS